MLSLTRLFLFDGFDLRDVSVSFKDKVVRIDLNRRSDKLFLCHRCGKPLGRIRGKYVTEVRELDIMGLKTMVRFWRLKGDCRECKKARAERIEFVSDETPHKSKRYADWLGAMCEFAAVSRVAEFCSEDNMTVRKVDYERMRKMLKTYKIPPVRRISVDEVYARKKSKSPREGKELRYFTIVTDMETRRVVWVSEGRSKDALDVFFKLIGERQCQKIEVAAMDQFDGYATSVRANCPNATIVWDRFHIMKSLEEAINETRKDLHGELNPKDPLFRPTMGRNRFLFLKKSSRRTAAEKSHIDQVLLENAKFAELEIIKERMFQFFDQPDEESAKELLDEVTVWVWQAGFKPLKIWFDNIHKGWDTLKNYFRYPVTSAVSEGINNVIKSLKRRAFGYRNMDYFKLKIMQVCGYLNSRYINEKTTWHSKTEV